MTYIPTIVGIGGTAAAGSSTEQAVEHVLAIARLLGCRTQLIGSEQMLALPHYGAAPEALPEAARALVKAVRAADGLVIASPGYHGSVSGLVKNALDYIEETAKDQRVYLDGLPVGLIATAYGGQASVNTLHTLRTITHALRGWPTPLGVAINSSTRPFQNGKCVDEVTERQLAMLGQQIVQFAIQRAASVTNAPGDLASIG
ncbi:NADPH-dependent FMN reductase [Paraburkholderia sp. J67]|uniref:NADPH-dependent FMN reductase n=1 Tax=Paraburkholderia sp. J67 TaxID=2805435 RepID=UPI002ABDBFDC|nr:NADPH-dependent FMN reductase [Paraburkholderia sp. J67]